MYQKDAGRPYVDGTGWSQCADGGPRGVYSAPAESTWARNNRQSEAEPPPPIAGELLAEIEDRISGLAGQLDAFSADQHEDDTVDVAGAEYLLDQFRILTFTVTGSLSRRLINDDARIPTGILTSIQQSFVALADVLAEEVGRFAGGKDRVDEIQRQSRSVSHKLDLVIETLCGFQASDLLNELAAILSDYDSIAAAVDEPPDQDLGLLGQRLGEVLVLFEDAVSHTDQRAQFAQTFQRVTAQGLEAIVRLTDQLDGEQWVQATQIQARFGLEPSTLANRCGD